MENSVVLLLIGFAIGTVGTLIGAGGGFLLVPLLLFTRPDFSPETITAISMAVVACNAISGSLAYIRSKRVDFRAGILFALFTIPGSVLGVTLTQYIPLSSFNLIFGVLLLALSVFLFLKRPKTNKGDYDPQSIRKKGNIEKALTDNRGVTYRYSYNQYAGIGISILVGFISPILGIGGGIIHVPAMVHWLNFPVYVATATSHFILAIMSLSSVATHAMHGTYNDPEVLNIVVWLCVGVVAGAQVGAFLSHKINTRLIIKALAICLGLVGLRIFLTSI